MFNLNTQNIWWNQSDKNVHTKLYPYIEFLMRENHPHYRQMLKAYQLYYGQNIISFNANSYYRNHTMSQEGSHRNLVSSICDTVVNQICSTEPGVAFYTIGADWNTRRQAEKLNKFLQGLFYQTNIYGLGPDVCLDAALLGFGAVYIFEKDSKVKIERVHPSELFYDLHDAKYGRPQQIFRHREATKACLIQLFPDKEKDIASANPVRNSGVGSTNFTDEIVEFWEVYKLPSNATSKDGKKAVILKDKTLVMEEYDKDYFPYAIMNYVSPPLGPYGISVAQRLMRSQVYVNRLLKLIDRSLVTMAVPRIWVQPGTGFNPDHYTQSIGAVIKSTVAPQILNQEPLPNSVYTHLADVIAAAREDVGISQLTSAAQKPAGITSGIALETLNDTQSNRLAVPSNNYANFFVDVAKISIGIMKEIAEENGEYFVEFRKTGGFDKVNWAELDIDAESFCLQANPIANITNKIPGKLQLLSTLQAAGIVSPAEMPRLLKNPDLDQFIDEQQASEELIYKQIDQMLDGNPIVPEDYQDLNLALKLVIQAINKADNDGAPEEIIGLLSSYIDELKLKLAPTPQPAPPQGAPQISQAPVAPLSATLAPQQ